MKTRLQILTKALALFVAVGLYSCADDGPDIGGGGSVPVADGIYVAPSGSNPSSKTGLVADVVENEGFATMTREGFVSGYMYLEAGSYKMVEVVDQEITKTYGGTATTETGDADNAFDDYILGAATLNGDAITLAEDGFYYVSMDSKTSEMIFFLIKKAGIIGAATEGGWGSDTELTVTGAPSLDGITFEATEVIMRKGEWKLRFNSNWKIDRRVDPNAGYAVENGYVALTNYGGALDNLVTGGSNFAIAEGDDAIYTVSVAYSPANGFQITLTKTGEAPVVTFVPEENQWALVGDAVNSADVAENDGAGDGTPDGWQYDIDLNYEGFTSGTNTYTWVSNGAIELEGGKAFKFRANDEWAKNMGWGGLTLTGDTDDFSDSSGNIAVGTTASYTVTLTTSDDGVSYTANFVKQ